MKKYVIVFIISVFGFNAVWAQLLSNQSEYFIKLTNGQSLSYFVATTPVIDNKKGTTNQAILKTPTNISNIKSITNATSDSLILSAHNVNDKKQVWIIEFFHPVSNIGTGTNNLNIAFDYTDAIAYFMIRNKENGKYLTWTQATNYNIGGSIQLSPLSKAGKDINQHWALNTVDPALRGKAKLFLGRSSIFGFAPRYATTDAGREYLTMKEVNSKKSIVLLPEYNSSLYKRGFNIEPAIKAEAIVLRDIETFCPTKLLRGDRDFNSGSSRNMSVYIKTELVISDSKTEIWANVYLKAEELGGDRTATEGNWQFKVYETIQGRILQEIVSPIGAYHLFETGIDEKYFKTLQKFTSDLINYYKIIGDTMGDDVSTDDNCGDDTRVERIKFNPIYVVFTN